MSFEVFMVMIIIETLILSVMTPCSLLICYHILRGTSYLNIKAECPSDAVSHQLNYTAS